VAHGDAGWVRPSDLKCSFSDPSAVLAPTLGEVTKVYYSSRDASKIAVTAPGMVNAGRSELSVYLPAIPTFNAVSKTEDGGDVYFKFQAANDAIVESFQPVAGYASGGMTVKATLRNWPSSIAFSSTQEVRATVGAAAQPAVVKSVSTSPADASDPTSSLNSVVEVVMPMISVGARRRLIFGNTQTITLTSELETFSVASFDFRFWPRPVNPPSIVSIVPEQLPLALRQIMRMRIANIGQINHAQDLDVTVGGRKATVVDFNMFNGYSVVYARSPILDQTGSVTVVVSNVNAPDTAEFSVDVFDPYKPEVIFASPTAGSAAGGTLVSVLLEFFDTATSADLQASAAVGDTTLAAPSVLRVVRVSRDVQRAQVQMPPGPAVGGVASVRLSVGSDADSFDFTYSSLPDGAATLVSAQPVSLRFSRYGGSTLRVLLGNFFSTGIADTSARFVSAQDASESAGTSATVVTSQPATGGAFSVEVDVPAMVPGTYNVIVEPKSRTSNRATISVTLVEVQPVVDVLLPSTGPADTQLLLQLSEFRPADLSDIRVEVGGVTLDSTAVGAQALTGRSNTYQLKFGCSSLGTERKDANIIVTTPSNSAILARTVFEYTPPTDPRIVLQIPQAGGQLGGDRVSFTIINTDLALAQSARIYFGSAAATSLSASMDAASTARAVLTCTAPAQQQAGDASGVVMLNNFNLTFQFHFIAPPEPSVESILPATVASTGGEEVTLVVRSLPVFASASELVVKMGNSYASVSAATVTEDDEDLHEIIATSPAIAPGTATVEVFVSSFSYLKAVGTIDVINAAVPNVDGLPKPSSGPTTGGRSHKHGVLRFSVSEAACIAYCLVGPSVSFCDWRLSVARARP
jgi:hypothetical protein